MKVWRQKLLARVTEMIVKRCSKPRPVHRIPGCCQEKTEEQYLSLNTEKIRRSQERVFREYQLLNNNKKLLGTQVLFLSVNSAKSMDLR